MLFSLYFLNMDISVRTQYSELEFSVYAPNIQVKEIMSQNFDLGSSFYFMTKKDNFW